MLLGPGSDLLAAGSRGWPARGLGRLARLAFPTPWSRPPERASGNISVLSTRDSPGVHVPRDLGPPTEKEPPANAHATPPPRERRSRRRLPRPGWRGPRPSRAGTESRVPRLPGARRVLGAGFAQVCREMPFPEPESWAGREGRVIDRLNYRLISYLRPRALIGCSLTSSNPAAPRWAREGGGCGWRCASDKPESHFQPQVDFVPTIGGVAPPLHGRGQTSSSAPLLMEPHLLGLLLGLLFGGTRVLAGYPIWW